MERVLGNLFILSAPSGTGKTSLTKSLLQRNINLCLSISYTSRLKRSNEVEGQDYHFVERKTFEKMLENGEFLESAEIYGNLYGSSQKWINETINSGKDVLLEIDGQGAQQVRKIFPNVVSIFILPPSLEVLEGRLKNRNQDSKDVIAKRMDAAKNEISHISEYDYVIINDNIDIALRELVSIVQSERLRMLVQIARYKDLVAQFL
ncbi:MAG: guanylate kinase [Nitrosomonadaceae bacterium]|nr:guanylate kinase [Nitrosomonadaceae bacterium]|tara:strand:- start:399 stop:1016 length:618 start_codon:yes stop_codon:yes gene_type:complete